MFVIHQRVSFYNYTIQGQKLYAGHRKHITSKERKMLPYFLDEAFSKHEFNRVNMQLNSKPLCLPKYETDKPSHDTVANPFSNACENLSSSPLFLSLPWSRCYLFYFWVLAHESIYLQVPTYMSLNPAY